MTRRKNVKRIDPRYFLNETVNRGEEIEEGVFSYDDSGRVRARELDAQDLDASSEERLAFEKDPRGHSRDPHTIDRSNAATNPPGKQDINQFLQQDHPEIWAMWNDVIADREARGKPFHRDKEEELEEGWDDIKDAAGKAWKKTRRGAERAIDTVKQTADDIAKSPLDMGSSRRRRRKRVGDERRADLAKSDAKVARRQALVKSREDKKAAQKSAEQFYRDREWNDPERLAKLAAEKQRSQARAAAGKAQYKDSLQVDKHKQKMIDREAEVTGRKDKRYSNTVGRGFEE